MIELITEMLIYLGLAALLGLVLGYLIWGWGMRGRMNAARAEGAATARTSVDGGAGLRERLDGCLAERKRLQAEVTRLGDALATAEAALDARDGAGTAAESVASGTASESVADDVAAESATSDTAAVGDSDEHAWDTTGDAADDSTPGGDDETAPEAPEAPEVAADAPAEQPAFLLDDKPEDVDDLKRIKGIGKAMEGILNGKGIYLFRQLANLGPDEIAWINEAIEAFPGRIERDDWVGQARTLYREKYGRAHDAAED